MNDARQRSPHRLRLLVTAAALAAALSLSACGGGGNDGTLSIGVVVGGQTVSEAPIETGGSLAVTIHVGQSLTLDAGESVNWTLYVGGSAVTGGALVHYLGADIGTTTLSSSAVALDTFASSPLQASIPVALVATSTFDGAQVATANVLITN